MLRIPELVVDEARRLSVETGLRMYVVGGLAAYAAHATDGAPKDHDLILVGDRMDYEEYEHNLTKRDEDDEYVIPFLPDGSTVTLTRTRFGGLRILVDGRPNTDLWYEPSVAQYLNRSDKGSHYAVDPVTAVVYKRVDSPVESADVYVDGKYEFHHQFEARQGKGWYADAVEPRLDGWRLTPGTHLVELREEKTHRVLRSWDYVKAEPAKAEPTTVKVRWRNRLGSMVTVNLPPAASDDECVRLGLSALADAGLLPFAGRLNLNLVVLFPTSAQEFVIAGRPDVNKWHVADGSGKSFDLYLHKDDHPRNHQVGIAKMAQDQFPNAEYVSTNLPGTYESYGFKVTPKPVPVQTWVVGVARAINPPRFQMPADAPLGDVQTEARRVWKGSGGLCLNGDTLHIQRLDERGNPVGAVTAFQV